MNMMLLSGILHFQTYKKNFQAYRQAIQLKNGMMPVYKNPVNQPIKFGGKTKIEPFKMAMLGRDREFNELFIKPIRGLYSEQSITVDEFKDRHESIMKNRWVDTSHGTKDDKIYGMFDPSEDSDITKENLQEWLCDHRLEVTECISIALHNHERSYAEWFRYVDSCSGPDELALYCLSRKMGIHMAVFNKSYIWTTLVDHITCTDEEIIQLCGVNLVFLGPAHYGILHDIRQPSKNMGPVVNPKSAS